MLAVIIVPFILSALEPGEAPNNSPSILAMLETLQSAPYPEVHKDMIRWVLKVRFLQSPLLFVRNLKYLSLNFHNVS